MSLRPSDVRGFFDALDGGVPLSELKQNLKEDRFAATAAKDQKLRRALRTLKVHRDGSITSLKTGKKLPGANLAGYRVHSLTVDKKRVQARAHRLVALSKGKIPKGSYVDHKDRDRSNNAPSNLRVTTPEGNAQNREKDGATPRLKEAVVRSRRLAEAKKKLAGNLCVNTGSGSGGGFTACSVSGGKGGDFPALGTTLKGPVVSDFNIKSATVYSQIGRRTEFDAVQKLLKSEGYTRADRAALNRYTRGDNPEGLEGSHPPFWVTFGRVSRDGAKAHGVSDGDRKIYQSAADETIRVMKSKLPQVDGIAYRGFDGATLNLKEGSTFQSDSFLSASYHPGTAGRFAANRDTPALMRIKGRSTFIGNASGFDEHEGVFMPGQKFRVVGIHKKVTVRPDRINIDFITGKEEPGPTLTVYDVVAIGRPGRVVLREATLMEAKKSKKSQVDRFTSTEFIRIT